MTARATIGAAVAAVVASSSVVQAQAPSPARPSALLEPHLTWEAPAGCPDRAAALARLDRLVPSDAAARPVADRLAPRVEIVEADGLHRLELRPDPASPPRVVQAAACEDVVDAAMVILAVVAFDVDPAEIAEVAPRGEPGDLVPPGPPDGGDAEGEADASAVDPAAEPPPANVEEPTDTPARSAAPIVVHEVLLGAGAALDAGPLPSIGVGPSAGAELVLGILGVDLAARLDVRFQPARTAAVATPAGNRAEGAFRLAAATLSGCVPVLRWGDWSTGPCASVDLGVVWGRGSGVSDPGGGRAPWVAVGGDLFLRWRVVAPLSLRLSGSLAGVPNRPDFAFAVAGSEDPLPVHRAGRLAGRVLLVAELAFPGSGGATGAVWTIR